MRLKKLNRPEGEVGALESRGRDRVVQQLQPPDSFWFSRLRPGVMVPDFAPLADGSGAASTLQFMAYERSDDAEWPGKQAYLSLICFDIVKKASSTFVDVLADVSTNGIDRPSANSCIKGRERSIISYWERENDLCCAICDDLPFH